GWNKKILSLLEQGKTHEVMALGPEYAKSANPEMQFKGFFWMMGALGAPKDSPSTKANVLGYGPLWGTGAAVIEFSNN
ncbi:MAG: hypothetical protein K2X66_17155, partial [Cyanobacteria bacterium]|nr:hypothetical protein [Cyanobacteriota bacterium]